MEHKIHYNKEGWVCERYPRDLPIDDKERFIVASEEEWEKTLSSQDNHAWKVVNGKLVEVRYQETPEEEVLETFRQLREEICFPVINRGQLWYEGLSDKQKTELAKWYKAWLEVTKTKTEPKPPSWLFSSQKINEKEKDRNGTNRYTTASEPTTPSADEQPS